MKDSLGDRMKMYEDISRDTLVPKIPVVVRVDGRAFHTYTKGFKRPFDKDIMDAMVDSAENLAMDMQNFVIGYVQSDEASFVMYDYPKPETMPWFGNNKQKIITISASVFTGEFNDYIRACDYETVPAVFDARAWNVPELEVPNYLLWRYKDWIRNSVSMYAREFFSHQELHEKSISDTHEMLHGINKNWATDLTPQQRNGTLLVRMSDGIKTYSPDETLTHLDFYDQFEDTLEFLEAKETEEIIKNI
jgi:tRNA(His) guanylyltransferase